LKVLCRDSVRTWLNIHQLKMQIGKLKRLFEWAMLRPS
jgi:hypothetical protein